MFVNALFLETSTLLLQKSVNNCEQVASFKEIQGQHRSIFPFTFKGVSTIAHVALGRFMRTKPAPLSPLIYLDHLSMFLRAAAGHAGGILS